ncbi:MAG: cytochrome c-type biogenesis protein CcmH [Betaproteobacteria bacterium]|nr:cytochrome c-type biogenesis protein CcmH [Betaproteobacteria bacterium]
MKRMIASVLFSWAVATGVAGANDQKELDAVGKARAVALAAELRCLVCQNQTIADSHAELAVDLRRQIHVQIAGGKSDAEIVDFMVTRYGDFVLYRPPFKATTAFLWLGPALFVLVGVIVLLRFLRTRRTRAQSDVPLTEAQRKMAAELLAGATPRESQ